MPFSMAWKTAPLQQTTWFHPKGRTTTMANPIIRPAVEADIDAMIALLHILFSIEKDFDADPSRQRLGLEMMLENDRAILLVAEIDSLVIGMCSGQLMISTAEGGFSLLVEDVVVDEPWQGKGVATALLTGLEDWAAEKQATRLQLLADRKNRKGLAFYHRLNWQQTQLICLCKRPTTINRER